MEGPRQSQEVREASDQGSSVVSVSVLALPSFETDV